MNVVEMKNISKSFPGTKAVDSVDFYIQQGEILSLLGENGAGKTTLMKILYGMHAMDSGEIFYKGKPVRIQKPSDAINLGICMVHQHFMLVSAFTVADNIIAGSEPCRGIFVDQKKAYKTVEDLIHKFHFNLDPNAKVGEQEQCQTRPGRAERKFPPKCPHIKDKRSVYIDKSVEKVTQKIGIFSENAGGPGKSVVTSEIAGV